MRTENVNFYSEGIKLAGVLYLPDCEQGKPYPGIVQGRPQRRQALYLDVREALRRRIRLPVLRLSRLGR